MTASVSVRRAAFCVVSTSLLIMTSPAMPHVSACSFGFVQPIEVNAVFPADATAYERGELGIFHRTYTRRSLVHAYRTMTGRPPAITIDLPVAGEADDGVKTWLEARATVLKTEPTVARGMSTYRTWGQYQHFDNCLGDTFITAAATLGARVRQFGATSAAAIEWTEAQDQVFANCDGRSGLVIPAPAAAGTHSLIAADRAYQTAAAYFYATEFEKAEALFRAIAQDPASPWSKYGRYLAARALIRRATLREDTDSVLLERADADLRAVVADPKLVDIAPAAARLRNFVAAKLRPVERLHELSARLAGAEALDEQDVIDYTRLMDRFVGDTVEYDYAGIAEREGMIRGDEMTDWILALQGGGEPALARALERWKAGGRTPWLLAVLWQIRPDHADTPAALAAAAAIPRGTPAFATAAFLRVRLRAARGERDAARRLLGELPEKAEPGFPLEAINLLEAERFMLAQSLDDLLRHAPRTPVQSGWSYGDRDRDILPATNVSELDRDAIIVMSERLPLASLLETARSPILLKPMRLAIASAALARAIMLRRDDAGLGAAEVWRTLEPSSAPELRPYVNAPDPESRHYAGILLLLRNPLVNAYVTAADAPGTFQTHDLDHAGPNWWCGFAADSSGLSGMYQDYSFSVLPEVTYLKKAPDAPEFLSAGERRDLATEMEALAALGTAPNYLAGEAVKWARARPRDTRAAEALARAVQGTRWGCTDRETGTYSRQAFQTLHRLFPKSPWAARTKYWYGGRG